MGRKCIKEYVLPLLIAIVLPVLFKSSCSLHYLMSGSMEPQYPTGSVVVVSKLMEPVTGTVCAYRRDGMTIVHRIMEETEDGYIFKGDANNVCDPYPVRKNEIEGRVLFALPMLIPYRNGDNS